MCPTSRRAPEQIETERLLLRPPGPGDAAQIFRRYASDPAVTTYMSFPRHRSLSDTTMFLDFSAFEWTVNGCGPYLVRSRVSGVVLGGTGLSRHGDEAETGYVFARDAWGKGYASESLRAMIDVARTVGLRALTAHCHPDHRASQHVLEKCGFALDHHAHATLVFPNLGPGRQDVLSYRYAL
jgi:ribosomal-protein-alanine N-acetyltransferase